MYNQLTELLKCTESEEGCKQFDKEVNSINELIKVGKYILNVTIKIYSGGKYIYFFSG